jgi:DNA polymerase III epsilon subunit-like protein
MKNVIVIDTETGGLDPEINSIFSVALVTQRSSIELKIRDLAGVADAEALQVNKISVAAHNENALSPGIAVKRIHAWLDLFAAEDLSNWTIAGHNVGFDLAFIARLYRIAQTPLPRIFRPYKAVDTSTLLWALRTKGLLPDGVKSADSAFAYFGIEVSGRHTAMGDAQATYTMLSELLKVIR